MSRSWIAALAAGSAATIVLVLMAAKVLAAINSFTTNFPTGA